MSMVEAQYLVWVFSLFFLHLVVPGPSMLFIFASAGRGELGRALAFIGGTGVATAIWAAIAAFGATSIGGGASLMLVLLKVGMGLTLVVVGARAIIAAHRPAEPHAASSRGAHRAAFTQGILITMASFNELVFWSAVLAFGAGVGAEPGVVFKSVMVVVVVVIAIVFETTLAWLAATGTLGRLMRRLRQPLEIALGCAFIVTGAFLLQPG